MKLDLTCPLELWQYSAVNDRQCRLKLYNLSDKEVESVQLMLTVTDEDGEKRSVTTERMRDLAAGAKKPFELTIDVPAKLHELELKVDRVWFFDGTVWRRGSAPLTEVESNAIPDSNELDMLRRMAGQDAIGYPVDHGALWTCVCGRPNKASSAKCIRCEREKQVIFSDFTEESVREVIRLYRLRAEEKSRQARAQSALEEEKRQEKIQKKKKRKKRVVICLVLLVILAGAGYGAYHYGLPYLRYWQAGQKFQAGLYPEAKKAYEAMGDYKDSTDLARECVYLQGMEKRALSSESNLTEAIEMLSSLGDYKDAAEETVTARYELARLVMSGEDYLRAAELFDEVADYEDAAELANRSRYLKAVSLMNSGSYSAARELFEQLGDYEDSREQITACLYKSGSLALNNGDHDSAIDLLTRTGAYLDAKQLLCRAYYERGSLLLEAEQFEAAGSDFLAAGDYLDATVLGSQAIYSPAIAAMEADDYAHAAELFAMIPGYQEADANLRKCLYAQAIVPYEAKDYAAAQPLFEKAIGYGDAKEKNDECLYRIAAQKMNDGDFAASAELLEQIPEYEDATALLKKMRYAQAEEALNNGNCKLAIALFEELDNYGDSAERREEAIYSQAVQYLDAGDSESALLMLKMVPENENAAELYGRIVLQDARALETSGKSEEALALFGSIREDSEEAAQAYEELCYRMGEEAKNSGLLQKAGALFGQIPDYLDAQQQSDACYDSYYQSVYLGAKEAIAAKDYARAVETMEGISMENLPAQYAELADMYNESCYVYAEALYEENKPYEALVYYEKIPDYQDVTEKKLQRACYRILGTWKSRTGVVMEFRRDGTCRIDGKEQSFYARMYSLYLGSGTGKMKLNYQITDLTDDKLTLTSTGEGYTKIYSMDRVTEDTTEEKTGE